jgi:hypothetical protein
MRVTQGPILILGAARSGTNLMRSLVARGSGLAQISHDVNDLWRLEAEQAPHDALSPSELTDEQAEKIRQELRRAAGVAAGSVAFVEKTVSNVLRIPYVQKVFPDARFVTVIRDGRDVAESALRSWSERPSVGHPSKKATAFPWSKYFGFAPRTAGGALSRTVGEFAIWGPVYPGIDVDLAHHDLLEVCARQWLACMEAYAVNRQRFAAGRFIEIHYEDLVDAPGEEAGRLAEFLKCERPRDLVEFAKASIRGDRVGGRKALPETEQQRVEKLLSRALLRWGYSLDFAGAERSQRAA